MGLGTGLDFEGQVKPDAISVDSYEKDLFAKRTTEIPSNLQARWVYDISGHCIYAAYAPKGLSESTNGWLLQKFEWSGDNCVKRTIAYDSYSNYLTASYS